MNAREVAHGRWLTDPRRHPIAALLSAAAIFSTSALFDLVARPADQGALHSYKEYVLTATILPAASAMLWVLASLQTLSANHNDRRGSAGLRVAAVGLTGLMVDSVVTMASGSTDTVGPLYPLAMIATLIGIVLLAIAWDRTRVLSRWFGPALAIGWLLGATPLLGSGGALLILAAAFVAIAARLRSKSRAPLAAAVDLDAPIAA